MLASERPTSLQTGSEQLLPGIPDEITLEHIVPRLPWKAFYILSSVSRAWLDGIRTRQVYDARVFSQSTETLLVVRFSGGASLDIRFGLCSLREDRMPSKSKYAHIHRTCIGLPPIPSVDGQYVSSDGYIYLLAAGNDYSSSRCSNKVFVFDWRGKGRGKSASMNERRTEFGCGVMHGKLYVFGGLSRKHCLNPSIFCGSEVYDPKEDRWTPISPMTTLRCDHKVETVGDELFVHGGWFFDRDHFNGRKMQDDDQRSDYTSDDEGNTWVGDKFRVANVLQVYHPVKDEWKVGNPFGRESRDCLFALGGKFYSIDWSSIHVYEGKTLGPMCTHFRSLRLGLLTRLWATSLMLLLLTVSF